MLAYVLALAVAFGSLAIYMAAFFFPEIHRKNDFIWSGVGLFYALVLWVCAGRITGGMLLGQTAGVALLGWSVTQMLQLRRQGTPRQQQTELPSAEEVKNTVQQKVSNLSISERFSQLGKQVSGTVTGVKDQFQQRASNLTQRQSKSDSAVSTQPLVTPATSSGTERSAAPSPPPIEERQPDEDSSRVQIIDNRTTAQPISTAAVVPLSDAEIQPALTEEEAIALAVETTLAEAATTETAKKEQESSDSEVVRPNPPAPELVEAAIRDAEEKSEDFSPPESIHPEQAPPHKE